MLQRGARSRAARPHLRHGETASFGAHPVPGRPVPIAAEGGSCLVIQTSKQRNSSETDRIGTGLPIKMLAGL